MCSVIDGIISKHTQNTKHEQESDHLLVSLMLLRAEEGGGGGFKAVQFSKTLFF